MHLLLTIKHLIDRISFVQGNFMDKQDAYGPYGRLAQLVRAPALQAGGHRFESYIAHHFYADLA